MLYLHCAVNILEAKFNMWGSIKLKWAKSNTTTGTFIQQHFGISYSISLGAGSNKTWRSKMVPIRIIETARDGKVYGLSFPVNCIKVHWLVYTVHLVINSTKEATFDMCITELNITCAHNINLIYLQFHHL